MWQVLQGLLCSEQDFPNQLRMQPNELSLQSQMVGKMLYCLRAIGKQLRMVGRR